MKYLIVVILMLLSAGSYSQRTIRSATESSRSQSSSTRYEYLLAEALRIKYTGDLNQAVSIFEKCISIDSERAVPYFKLAQIYSTVGDGRRALKYAAAAANIEPGNYWFQLACGSLFVQYNQKDSAIVYFERSLRADSSATGVKSILAGLYTESGMAEKADSLYRILELEGAMSEDMFLMMISGLVNSGKFDAAAKRAEKLIESAPSEIRYKALLADIYLEAGKKEMSDSIYKELIENDPENIENQLLYLMNLVYNKEYTDISGFLSNVFISDLVDRDSKVAIVARLLQDTVYVRENMTSIEESLVLLEEMYPKDEAMLSMRPAMYELTGRKEDAIKRYEVILKTIKPGYYFKEKLILLYAENSDYDKLFTLASVYATENNVSLLGKVYYANAAMELKKYDIAEAELKKALILAGNNDELKIQVLTMMGDLKYRMKDFQGSYEYYEEALALSPHDPLVLNNYAYFLAEGDIDLNRALKMAEEVMITEGDNETYIDTYAWVLYKKKKYRKAYEAMLRIFEKENERDPEILEHMGYILEKLGKCSEAVDYWRLAIEKDKSKTHLTEKINKCGR